MSYCNNRCPKYGTLSTIWIQRTEIAFSIAENKRLYVCLNVFSGPQIIYCQHTLHQYAYPSTKEILPRTFDSTYLAEGLLSQKPDITFLLSGTMQYAQYNIGPLSLVC